MATQATSIKFSKVELEWSEDSSREIRACRVCETPTTGRMKQEGKRAAAPCLSCSLSQAFEKARI